MAILSHRHGWSSLLALFVLPWLLLASSATDAPVTTYRAGASEVRVTFFATDENNRPVDTIVRDDFAVVDGETAIRDFRSLTRSNETPLEVVAVVDASESVAPRFQTAIRGVLQLVSQDSLAAEEKLSVISFSGLRPALICSGDCRSPAARQRLLAIKAAGPTPLFDTLLYAANFISRRRVPGVEQVLILFSDGDDTISMTSARDALQALLASGVLLYAVDLNKSPAPVGSAVLEYMAEATGGRSFSVRKGSVDVLEAAVADLRASYVVTYPLPNHIAGFHPLRILPKHNLKLRFHCRNGYYYENRLP